MTGTANTDESSTPSTRRRWVVGATLGSVVSAFAASACCLGPLLFGLLGIGGAGLLVKFEPYRPTFSAVTLALLGTGFYLTYRRPKVALDASDPSCACGSPRANRAGRVLLWAAAAVSIGFLAYPSLEGLLSRCG